MFLKFYLWWCLTTAYHFKVETHETPFTSSCQLMAISCVYQDPSLSRTLCVNLILKRKQHHIFSLYILKYMILTNTDVACKISTAYCQAWLKLYTYWTTCHFLIISVLKATIAFSAAMGLIPVSTSYKWNHTVFVFCYWFIPFNITFSRFTTYFRKKWV